jgi:hypothetical protein
MATPPYRTGKPAVLRPAISVLAVLALEVGFIAGYALGGVAATLLMGRRGRPLISMPASPVESDLAGFEA